MNRSTKWFLVVLFTVAFGIAVAYVIYWQSSVSIDGFYTVTDSFVDTTSHEAASVSFVQVEEYDSVKVIRVAEHLTQQALEGGDANALKRRTFLYHFYTPGDTASLTQDMIDELSYTHPAIVDAEQTLMVIPGGIVVKATFSEKSTRPETTDVRRTQFYMPRAGIRAKDFR